MTALRWPIAFGRFWWDFIVGDSMTLAIGGLIVLLLALFLARALPAAVGEIAIPVAVAGTLALSVRGRPTS